MYITRIINNISLMRGSNVARPGKQVQSRLLAYAFVGSSMVVDAISEKRRPFAFLSWDEMRIFKITVSFPAVGGGGNRVINPHRDDAPPHFRDNSAKY